MSKHITYLVLLIVLAGLASIVIPRVVQASITDRCCYYGPGRCELADPESGQCPIGPEGVPGLIRIGDCASYEDCAGVGVFNPVMPTIRCCVCQPVAQGDLGTCDAPASQDGNICGTTTRCRQSTHDCIETVFNPECEQWNKSLEEIRNQKPLFFSLNLTIPGSGKFNAGEDIRLTGQTLGEYIAALYVFFVGIAGILATIMIMYGGFIYVTAFGNPQKISQAKDTITSALLGLALSLGAYVVLLTINPNLVRFTGLTSLTPIGTIIQSDDTLLVPEKGAAPGLEDQYLNPTLKIPKNVSKWDQLITTVAGQYRDWIKTIMLMESSGRPDLVSGNGACGILQLLPSTANLTCEQLKDPETGMRAGVKYFLEMLNGGSCPKETAKHPCYWGPVCVPQVMSFVLASYNGGPGANWCSKDCHGETIWQCHVNTRYQQTRDYVSKGNTLYGLIHSNASGYEWTVPAP